MGRAARSGAPPRIHVAEPLAGAGTLRLAPEPSRHLQVLRLQPGDALTLFDGRGGEWSARLVAMARDAATVALDSLRAVERELAMRVTLAIGMPANDRMDLLVEKATELGVDAVQPLESARSVLRLEGERGRRRIAHWQAVAVAACEQCGRNRVPEVREVCSLEPWLVALAARDDEERWLLAPGAVARAPFEVLRDRPSLIVLSGPEGGFTVDEEAVARKAGFRPVSLGPRVLRADTAPLAVLAACALLSESR